MRFFREKTILKIIFRYVPPSPNRLDEDISEIMQKEGSDNDSQTGDEVKENEQPAKRLRHDDSQWDSSDMFLVETPVSLRKVFNHFAMLKFPLCRVKLLLPIPASSSRRRA